MRFAVIVFPGTWSDGDCYYVLNDILGQPTDYVWHRQADLSPYDCIILPGGFSWGECAFGGGLAPAPPPPCVPGARGEGECCPYVQLAPIFPLNGRISPPTVM